MKHLKKYADFTRIDEIFNVENMDITKEVARKLGKKIVSELGEPGKDGAAYMTDKGTVLKFSRNSAEANLSKHLMEVNSERFAEVYSVVEHDEVYVIEKEYLKQDFTDKIWEAGHMYDNVRHKAIQNKLTFENYLEFTTDEKINSVKQELLYLNTEYNEIRKEGEKLGLRLTDLNIDNCGFKNGKIAAFDVYDESL